MTDTGSRLVGRMIDLLGAESEWILRRPNGFIWWPRDHAQSVTAEAVIIDGTETCQVDVQTEVWSSLPIVTRNVEMLNLFGREASLSGLLVKSPSH